MKSILTKRRLCKGIIPLLCLLLFPTLVFAQKLTVNGQVKDTQGEPITGANVAIKGTTTGTITDLDGMFSIPDVRARLHRGNLFYRLFGPDSKGGEQ